MTDIELNAVLKDGFTVMNSSRGHKWISDEPIPIGGLDSGPSPKELLLSSLASCKLITVRMYAERKGWVVDRIDVRLKFLEQAEKTIIEKSISFSGDLDEAQTSRLTDISGRCPIVKMLSNSIEFKIV